MATEDFAQVRMEQPGIWGRLHENPDIADKLRHFRQMLPEGTRTILDVGCGDGALTNPLAEDYEVTGVDLSETALSHLTTTAVRASATALPFEAGSFDVVLSSQVLEHLPDEDYRVALTEMRRVARRHLLLSVPFQENLPLRTVRCPACGTRHHVFGHLRRFTVDSFLEDVGLPATDIRVFGPLQEPWPRPVLWASHHLARGFYVPEGQSPMCPSCGNTDYSATRGIPGAAFVTRRAVEAVRARPRQPFWLAMLFTR